MAAVRRGVDEHDTVRCPHHVPAPQITVQAGRRIAVVEARRFALCDHRVDGLTGRGAQSARGARRHRRQPLTGVERTPSVVFPQRHRKWLVQWPEEALTGPSGGRGTERVGARVVGASQPAAELMRGGAIGPDGVQSLQRETGVVVTEHLGARHTAVSGRKPLQPCGLTGEESCGRAAVALDERRHPTAGRTPAAAQDRGASSAGRASRPPLPWGRPRRRSGRAVDER